jgi:hypothetical protein
MTKRFVLILALLAGLVSGAWAGFYKSGNVRIYYLSDFLSSVNEVKSNLIQKNTGRVNSCGVTSALFAYNYVKYLETGTKLNTLRTLNTARKEITSLYKYAGLVGDGTGKESGLSTFDPLVMIGSSKWLLDNVEQRYMSDPEMQNLIYLINDLRRNIPIIVSLKAQPTNSGRHNKHSLNPVGKWNHIVIIYAYAKRDSRVFSGNDIIYYFDPFFGGSHWMTLDEFRKNGNQDNMDYLRFGK